MIRRGRILNFDGVGLFLFWTIQCSLLLFTYFSLLVGVWFGRSSYGMSCEFELRLLDSLSKAQDPRPWSPPWSPPSTLVNTSWLIPRR